MVLCTVVVVLVPPANKVDGAAVTSSSTVLHAGRPGEDETLCGLLVGDIVARTWPPAMGGCFRCHEVEQRELRAW